MDNPAAISPFQPFAQMFGGQQGVTPGSGSTGGIGGGINNMISALMGGYNSAHNAHTLEPNAATYEGNIKTPANPFGSVTPPAMPQGMPPPQTGGAPSAPPSPSAQPPTNPFVSGAHQMPFMSPTGAPSTGQMPGNPFAGGAAPSPFLNGSALFGQLPMTRPSAFAQRPNPISSMQL